MLFSIKEEGKERVLMLDQTWLRAGFIIENTGQVYGFKGPFHFQSKPYEDRPSFFIPSFFETQPLYWSSEDFFQLEKSVFSNELIKIWKDLLGQSGSISKNESKECQFKIKEELNWNVFEEQFKNFQSSNLKKVVATTYETYFDSVSDVQKVYFLYHLLQSSQGYVYGFWNEKEGILGLTPEYLFQRNSNQFQTMALAGTAPKDRKDFLQDEKEKKEQSIVVQSIKERLSHIPLRESPMYEYIFGSIKHLRTDLEAVVQNIDFGDLVSFLHPTPALGGFPRKEALEWLHRYNKSLQRKKFGAPFGLILSQEKQICLVAIRNIQWNLNEKAIFVGCGLTSSSEINKEWKELQWKKEAIIQNLNSKIDHNDEH